INTLVLLISSFTVAASITAVQRQKTGQAIALILFSLGCGLTFLVNKYFEWGAKFEHGLYPNSDRLYDAEPGFNIFFGLYYTITGLHGLHVVIGMILLSISLVLVIRGRVSAGRYAMLENSGLYWHLVDLIWIYVFPLFYLVL
ncbi:MAG: cytochrome c oxidase subunit 3, partial [Desulfofustis sp.]|nr:cytochrome c oxidase subunit 3 [Desulfofustis sp.]